MVKLSAYVWTVFGSTAAFHADSLLPGPKPPTDTDTRLVAIEDVNKTLFWDINVAGFCCGAVSHVLSICPVLGAGTHVCTRIFKESLSSAHTEDN